jgi:hypothetical protein
MISDQREQQHIAVDELRPASRDGPRAHVVTRPGRAAAGSTCLDALTQIARLRHEGQQTAT